MRQVVVALTLLGALAGAAVAQDEAALERAFEGKTVTLKIAMPGTENGVDIHPGTDRPLDYGKYAGRLKEYGTAIRPGDAMMVTKVRVKDKHIEFQLGGGGYGTFGDDDATSISVPSTPKSKREQNLEGELKRETDPARRRAIKEELDDLRREREWEDARLEAMSADAEEARKQNVRQRRIEGGSRFNIRYTSKVGPAQLTPASIEAALADYVDFGRGAGVPEGLAPVADAVVPATPVAAGQPPRLRKGLLADEVEDLLGKPVETKERKEGALKVVTRSYLADGERVTGEFVEGVLIRYTRASD